jgi:hypothetical protein
LDEGSARRKAATYTEKQKNADIHVQSETENHDRKPHRWQSNDLEEMTRKELVCEKKNSRVLQ